MWRRSLILSIVAIGALCIQAAHFVQAQSQATLDIPLTVTEASQVARTNEIVTSGVPIPASALGSSWSLFNQGQEIPIQTTELPNRTSPFLLVDFPVNLLSSGTTTFHLRNTASTVAPTSPLVIAETSSTITVATGPLQTQLSKTDFNLFDTVWLDQNSNASFETNERLVTPAAGTNISVIDAATGQVYTGRGAPQTIAWEYQGPLRATLRIDGKYVNGGTTLLHYTTRITWYAGRTDVRVEQVLRNSFAPQERYIKLSSAKIDVGSSATTARITRSGDTVWSHVTPTGVGVELVPPTLDVSTAYDPNAQPPIWRSNATIDVDANGGLIIGDLSYHGATLGFDFAQNIIPAEAANRATAFADPLFALADQSWYAQHDAFGLHNYGTYADEQATYAQWGWTWPTSGDPRSQPHNLNRVKNIPVSWSNIDAENDPESDDLWQNVIMYSRVGMPFFLDRARAWNTYLKWQWAPRTDGYIFDGQWYDYWLGPQAVARTPVLEPTLTSADQAYIQHNIKFGKSTSADDHLWNGGLLDYYYLTGDKDSLQAAIDVAEQCQRINSWLTPQNGGAGGDARAQSRCLLILVRTWEATNDSQWLTAAQHMLPFFLQSPTYDQRGFFYRNVSDLGSGFTSRFSGPAKEVTPFMMSTAVEALYRYYQLTDDQAVKLQLLQIAAFGRDHGLDPVTGFGGDYIVVDSPQVGDVQHLSYSAYRNTSPIYPTAASSTESFINAMVIAYRLTGDLSYMQRAKLYWNQGTKRTYVEPYTSRIATDAQVGRWANSMQGLDPNYPFFPEGGDWTSMSLLFHDALGLDNVAPSTVTDLRTK